MNHAIIAWLKGNGHEVAVFLPGARLRAVVERYDIAPVAGIGVRHWRGHVFPARPREGLAILARGLLGRLPPSVGSALRKRLRMRRYGLVDAVLGAFLTPEQSAWCAGRIENFAPDAVLADTIFRAPVLREPALARVQSAIIAHDVFHLRHRALRDAGYRVHPAELTRETEAGLLRLAKIVAAIQPEEAAMFRELCPDRAVCTLPMPASPCPRPETVTRIPDRLVFVGSATLPNLDGLRWLFTEIWPRLAAMRPSVTLDLVGDCGAALPALPPGVARLGRVRELSPILHRSALAISPLRVGSGLKIKILDYARHGLTTVATTESLAGFAADENRPFIAARDAAGFAEAVAASLCEPEAAAEQRALDYVTRHYDTQASFAGLAAALRMPV